MKNNLLITILFTSLVSLQNANAMTLACRAKHPTTTRQSFVFVIPHADANPGTPIDGTLALLHADGSISAMQKPFLKVSGGKLIFQSGGYKITLPDEVDPTGDGFTYKGTLEVTFDAPPVTNRTEIVCAEQI